MRNSVLVLGNSDPSFSEWRLQIDSIHGGILGDSGDESRALQALCRVAHGLCGFAVIRSRAGTCPKRTKASGTNSAGKDKFRWQRYLMILPVKRRRCGAGSLCPCAIRCVVVALHPAVMPVVELECVSLQYNLFLKEGTRLAVKVSTLVSILHPDHALIYSLIGTHRIASWPITAVLTVAITQFASSSERCAPRFLYSARVCPHDDVPLPRSTVSTLCD